MRVLVIPDVHLKPYLFHQASELMEKGEADRAVCLMDIPDDWNREYDIGLYVQTYDAAIEFAKSIRTLSGHMEIMICVICGMKERADTAPQRPGQYRKNCWSFTRLCRKEMK